MIIDNALYRDGLRVDTGLAHDDVRGVYDLITASDADDFVWVGLHEPSHAELAKVAKVFKLHPLSIEDAFAAHQRPKLERYDDYLFVLLKTLWYVDEQDAVETGEVALFVGKDFVVTVRHGKGVELHHARRALESMRQVLQHGPSAVLYTVCDQVVDRYQDVAEALTVDVDEIEASVFSEERTEDSKRIYILKREIAEMRRAVLPLREPVNRFAMGAVSMIHTDAAPYFRDVADHIARVTETIDNLDVLLSAAFEAHMVQTQILQNDDMRKISVYVGMLAVPTVIGSIYGMNFTHMPELAQVWGYPMALGIMLFSSFMVWLVAKRSKWV